MDTRAPRAPSIVASLCQLPWRASVVGSVAPDGCPLVRAAAGALPAALREDATSVVIGSPPFEVGQEMWGLLRSGPGTASKGCHAMADGQWSPLKKGRVQPTREAQSL
jgi:hypothetical protein